VAMAGVVEYGSVSVFLMLRRNAVNRVRRAMRPKEGRTKIRRSEARS